LLSVSILGGLLIVNANDGGIAYEHIEKIWGDIARADKVLAACSRVSGVPVSEETAAKANQEHAALHQKMQQSSYAKGQDAASNTCAPATAATPATESGSSATGV
jgi:hypothetical protein